MFEWAPTAYRLDQDPEAEDIYDNCWVATEDSGTGAHTAMHGRSIGYLAGLWIGDPQYFGDIVADSDQLPVPLGDYGE